MSARSTSAAINVNSKSFSHHRILTRIFADGLTYAGVGWAIWRDKSFLPDEILFTVNYLGSPQVSFTLNFSKSSVHVIGQYYQFLRLGKSGYRNIVSYHSIPTYPDSHCNINLVVDLDEQPDFYQ